jgi:uncharacterized protein (TIGR03437 family)
VSATLQTYSPAFFLLKDNASISAIHSSGALVGATTLYAGDSTPAAPGETIALFGTGFGTTNPAISDGSVVTAPQPVTTMPTVTVGGTSATVVYAGLISAGVYQINVTVPLTATTGSAVVTASIGGVTSASNATIAVQQ